MNGITIVPIGEKFAKVVTEASAAASGGSISSNTNLPVAGKFVTQIIQVKYAAVQDLVEILKPFSRIPNSIIALPSTQTLILRDYAENVARMLEMVKKIDVLTPLIIKPEIIPIRYALASDIASALSALGASGGTSVGKSSSGANFGGSRSGNGTMGAGGAGGNSFGGSGGGYPGQASTTGGIGSAATGARSTFQNNLQKIVNNAASAGQFQLFGQTKIIADERTNSLLVFANDDDMKMIKDIIKKLDVVLAQVLIDAIIMEINLTGTQNTGVSYLVQRQNAGTFAGAGGLNNLSSAASGFLTGSGSSSNGASTTLPSGSTLANLPAREFKLRMRSPPICLSATLFRTSPALTITVTAAAPVRSTRNWRSASICRSCR
jgi:general secretion pathway protein D